jgi:threonine dehydratase
MLNGNMITRERIASIEPRIRPFVRHTPVLRVDMADFGRLPLGIDLKLECLQHSGSFKARGAFTNLLERPVPKAGVVAASGGNHGAAVAYAAMRLGHKATIFVPEVSPPAKLERIRGYGADLVVGGGRYAEALAASEDFAEKSGALQIHAFNQEETLVGQGTLGLEIEADLPELDTLLVAVGGGGLIGGIAAWFAGRIRIIAVEPEGAPTLYRAFEAGRPVDAPAEGIAADSLAPKRVGGLMFPIAEAFVERSILVGDDEIVAAQAALWDRAAPRPSLRSFPAATRRPRASASPCWSAVQTPIRLNSDDNASSPVHVFGNRLAFAVFVGMVRVVRFGLSRPTGEGPMTQRPTFISDRSLAGRLALSRLATRVSITVERGWPLLLPLVIVASLFLSVSWLGLFLLLPDMAHIGLLPRSTGASRRPTNCCTARCWCRPTGRAAGKAFFRKRCGASTRNAWPKNSATSVATCRARGSRSATRGGCARWRRFC